MRLFLVAIMVIVSYGCASSPPAHTHATKHGTQKAYQVDGKWYYPADTSMGYEEEGMASWYGKDFHGKKTSNGEIYNMNAMTAAHKTLPLGTYVRVIRMDNNKETMVRVNDRGPFVKGRIIDLSYKAATELGITATGTSKVRIVAMGDAVGDRFVKRDYQKGNFMVQVGAFTVKENAVGLKESLAKRYSDVSVFTYDRGDKIFYRVRVGGASSPKEAEALKTKLDAQGMESTFIVAE